MAYKMKGFSGFKSSPAKQYKQPTGPRAKVKSEKLRSTPMTSEQMDKAHNISARITEGSIESQALRRKENKRQVSKAKMKALEKIMKSPTKQTKFPDSEATKKVKNERKLAKMDAEYAKGLPARISVDNPEHKGGSDDAWERMQNDHDVDDSGVPQTGAKEYYIKTGIKPKK